MDWLFTEPIALLWAGVLGIMMAQATVICPTLWIGARILLITGAVIKLRRNRGLIGQIKNTSPKINFI